MNIKRIFSICVIVLMLALLLASCCFDSSLAHEHIVVADNAVAPSCASTGLTAGTHCSECGQILVKQEIVPASEEHTYDDGYDAVCNICSYDRYVDCTHADTGLLPAKAATCSETGLTEGKRCFTCGIIVLAQNVTERIPHTDGEWITDKEPTETETGKKHQVCAFCGEAIREEIIPMIVILAYEVNDDGITCTVTGVGPDRKASLRIPEYIDGYRVTAIGAEAFANQTHVTKIIIPETVTTIGDKAFYGCTGLTEITIPASVTDIGSYVFKNASNLSTVYYNSTYGSPANHPLNGGGITKVVFGGTKVPQYALYCSGKVKEVEIKDSVTSIGTNAFYGCDNLESVIIGNGVKTIGSYAFLNCSSLKTIVIPDSVTAIGYQQFLGCSSLTSVVMSSGVKEIVDYMFSACSSLTSIVIPNSITDIGAYAFQNCESLTNIDIPDSVDRLERYAFDGCTNLTSITFAGTVEQWNAISKDPAWDLKMAEYTVYCTDGNIAKNTA